MARSKVCISLALIISFFLIFFMAESRDLGIGFGKVKAVTVSCSTVYGTEEGDTCSAIAQQLHLSLESFLAINPNVNCETIFVGQWLCIDGSVSA